MDPRLPQGEVRSRSANHSRLMESLVKSGKGGVKNWCPYGCVVEDLDSNGYCRHLIGISEDCKLMEPMVTLEDNKTRVVRVTLDDRGKPVLEPVLKTDHLERITTCYRVYRDVDNKIEKRPVNKEAKNA